MSPRHLALWARASSVVGGGHVIRCLALAETLVARGWRCTFVVDAATEALLGPHLAVCPSVETVGIADSCPHSVVGAFRDLQARWIVYDDYQMAVDDERASVSGDAFVVAIDDLANRAHKCDLLVDAMPYRKAGDYDGLVPRNAKRLIGSSYALLRSRIGGQRERSLARRSDCRLERIMVGFGLGQTASFVTMTLESIARSAAKPAVDILVASELEARAIPETAIRRLKDVRVHVNLGDPTPLMVSADLAIGAPGGFAVECCVLGLPRLHLITADHQRRLAAWMRDEAAIPAADSVAAGSWLTRQIEILSSTPDELRRRSVRSATAFDGLGASRVADQIDAVQVRH